LPIIETQEGEVSAYIPTNVISITDGQIYLLPNLFASGVRPAIDAGISVSRVGGNAQTKAMKKVAGSLRLEMAQYRELLSFSQLGTEVDKATQNQLARGEKLVELLKQAQFVPLPMEDQVLIFLAASKGTLDKIPNNLIVDFEKEFLNYVHSIYSEIPALIKETGDIPDEEKIKEICSEFLEKFTRDHQAEMMQTIDEL
jgi:F-type H+-transporting ATPase subunit alpha